MFSEKLSFELTFETTKTQRFERLFNFIPNFRTKESNVEPFIVGSNYRKNWKSKSRFRC